MEHINISHEIAKEYQAEHNRKARFDKWSNDERFYIETFDGGMLLKNYFLAHRHYDSGKDWFHSERDDYFLFRRDGYNYTAMSAIFSHDGISIHFHSGIIYRQFQSIESTLSGCEFLEPEQFIKNLETSIQKHFTNFKINI